MSLPADTLTKELSLLFIELCDSRSKLPTVSIHTRCHPASKISSYNLNARWVFIASHYFHQSISSVRVTFVLHCIHILIRSRGCHLPADHIRLLQHQLENQLAIMLSYKSACAVILTVLLSSGNWKWELYIFSISCVVWPILCYKMYLNINYGIVHNNISWKAF